MKFLRRFFIRLSNFAAGRRADQRLREEMAEHLALQTEENLRAGMSPAEARRQAALKLGAAQAIREQHNAEQGLPLAENLLVDLRYAFRMLHRSPGFSLIAIATMALGVGATTAIYSVIDATLLHPLPYPHPSELVRIEANLPGVGAHDIGISIPELRDLQNSGIFQYVSLSFFGTNNLTGSAQPASIASKSVSPSYFAVLGVDAQLGRTWDPHDATPGFIPEVVISDGLWKRAFGADPHILGKSLRLDNDVYHVVGVMPAGFRDQGQTSEERSTDLWAAAGFSGDPAPPPMRGTRFPFETIARLQPGLSPEAAQGRLDALVASLKKQYPADYPPPGRVDSPPHSPGRDSCRQRSPIAHSAVRRGGPGPADQLRQRRQSAACSRQRARTRDGGSPGIGSRKNAPDSSAPHRELVALRAWRHHRFRGSLLRPEIPAAICSRKPAAPQ